jgi:large subunit ribosomal protein L32
MGAVPKVRVSKARGRRRRTHQVLRLPDLVECPQCHELMRHHRACPHCGTYRGMQVTEPKEE